MFESTGGVMPRELVPQQRMGNEEELAGTILYLASRVTDHSNFLLRARTDLSAGRWLLQRTSDGP